MKSKIFQICIVTLTFFSLNISNLLGQLSARDSVIIKKNEAVKLTDSLNSTVPKNIRLITIEFLSKRGLNPDEYYTLRSFRPSIGRALNYSSVGVLHLLRINALRDLSDDPMHVGASGGEGDDILILFDKDYKKVKGLLVVK